MTIVAAAVGGLAGCTATAQPITIRVLPEGVPSYTGRTENAAQVAFQDGEGSWTALQGTDGVYHATATSPFYAVAVGCAPDDSSTLRLYYQAVSDTTDLPASGCPRPLETVPVTVQLDGVPLDQNGQIWLGSASVLGAEGQPVAVDLPTGTVDVLATTYMFAPATFVEIPVRGYRAPAPLDLHAAQALKIDLGALGMPFETYPLRVIGFDPADGVEVISSYATPHSLTQWTFTEFPFPDSVARTPDTTYATLDARMRQPGDVSNLRALTTHTAADGRRYDRYVRLAMTDPVAQTVELPPALVVGPPVFDSAANRRATVTIPIAPATLNTADYTVALYTSVRAGPADSIVTREVSLFVQSGWVAGAPASVTITTPDLSQLPGWTDRLALFEGADVDWLIERDDRTLPYHTPPTDGRKVLVSDVQGTIVHAQPAGTARAALRHVRRQLGD